MPQKGHRGCHPAVMCPGRRLGSVVGRGLRRGGVADDRPDQGGVMRRLVGGRAAVGVGLGVGLLLAGLAGGSAPGGAGGGATTRGGAGAWRRGGAGAATPTGGEKDAAAVWRELVRCARANGMPNLPDPQIDSNGRAEFPNGTPDPPASVRRACQSISDRLPASARGGEGGRGGG